MPRPLFFYFQLELLQSLTRRSHSVCKLLLNFHVHIESISVGFWLKVISSFKFRYCVFRVQYILFFLDLNNLLFLFLQEVLLSHWDSKKLKLFPMEIDYLVFFKHFLKIFMLLKTNEGLFLFDFNSRFTNITEEEVINFIWRMVFERGFNENRDRLLFNRNTLANHLVIIIN